MLKIYRLVPLGTSLFRQVVTFRVPGEVFYPGNFATNISGGSKFSYNLLWVILWSNLMAIFLQSMSAKLGIATGYNLPQMCGKVFSRKTNWIFWIFAELAAIATNLAEFLGSTLGLYLLFHIPMVYSAIIIGILTFLIVYIGKYGQRAIEIVISILVAVICAAYILELCLCSLLPRKTVSENRPLTRY